MIRIIKIILIQAGVSNIPYDPVIHDLAYEVNMKSKINPNGHQNCLDKRASSKVIKIVLTKERHHQSFDFQPRAASGAEAVDIILDA